MTAQQNDPFYIFMCQYNYVSFNMSYNVCYDFVRLSFLFVGVFRCWLLCLLVGALLCWFLCSSAGCWPLVRKRELCLINIVYVCLFCLFVLFCFVVFVWCFVVAALSACVLTDMQP